MSELVVKTVNDLRCGRSSWRVLLLLSIAALCAGIIAGVIPLR